MASRRQFVASESRMRAITSALPDVLLVLDENGRHLGDFPGSRVAGRLRSVR